MVATSIQQFSSSTRGHQEPVGFKNPLNFSKRKKALVVIAGISLGMNANLGSSLPSGAIDAISEHFSVTSSLQLVLLNSLYLLGCALGPLIFGPLSEHIGRRPVLIGGFLGYTISTLCCGLSPNYSALLLFRFIGGTAAAAPIAVIGPLYADIYDDPEQRGNAIAYFTCTCVAAPEFGPIISGYASPFSWNLPFWIGGAIAGVCLPLVLSLPETFAPVIKRRAMRGRNYLASEESGISSTISKDSLIDELKIIFSRPFNMITREPVVLFTSIYCASVYAILFLFFQAYPIIFSRLYGLSPGQVGLTFLPIAAGCILSLFIFIGYSVYHKRALKAGLAWATKYEYRRLPLACGGGPAISLALFWLGWTSYSSVHPAIPALSGLLFGIGYLMIFMVMLNYLSDAYRQYAASAQAAAGTARSLVGVFLPLAASPMYETLGIQWACSLLAFITLAMALIPFAFIKYGEALRKRSPFCEQISKHEASMSHSASIGTLQT